MIVSMNQSRWKSLLLLEPGLQWVLCSVCCYTLACLLPAYELQILANNDVMYGWQCLMAFPLLWWWANPLYLFSIVAYCVEYRRTSAVLGALAMFLALHFEFMVLGEGQSIRIGCIFWTVSLQVLFLNAVWHVWLDRKRRFESLLSSDPI